MKSSCWINQLQDNIDEFLSMGSNCGISQAIALCETQAVLNLGPLKVAPALVITLLA